MKEVGVKVVKKHGIITGKELFKVRGDPNGWCGTPQEALGRHYKCAAYWNTYHNQKGKK